MPMTENFEKFLEERRDRVCAMYYDLKTRGMRQSQIFAHIAVAEKMGADTVRHDLEARGVIGRNAIRKMQELTRKDINNNSKPNKRETK